MFSLWIVNEERSRHLVELSQQLRRMHTRDQQRVLHILEGLRRYYAKRITNYAEYEILNIHSFPFSFFYSLKDSLATEDIMTFIDGMNIISHGGYEECRFEIADFKEGFHVYSRVLETYQYSLHAAYLNAIRSELYLISRH